MKLFLIGSNGYNSQSDDAISYENMPQNVAMREKLDQAVAECNKIKTDVSR